MGNVTTISSHVSHFILYAFIIINVILLLIYIFVPYYLYKVVAYIVLKIIYKTNELKEYVHKNAGDDRYLLYHKMLLKLDRIIYRIIELCYHSYIIVYNRLKDIDESKITRALTEGKEMAVRAVAVGRHYFYVLKRERTITENNKKRLMNNDEAVAVADANGWTVFELIARSARQQADERDKMTELRSKGKQMVYELRQGTMDHMLLLGCLAGWRNYLPPIGMCERCTVDHGDGYLDYNLLINSKANQMDKSRMGMFKNEIAIDHIGESDRTEIAAFVRTMDGNALGEELEEPTDGSSI